MAVQPFSTGDVAIVVGIKTATIIPSATNITGPRYAALFTPRLLGWTGQGPEPDVRTEYASVPSDRAGERLPRDDMFLGQEALHSIDLSEWDYAVLDLITRGGGIQRANGVVGREDRYDRGTLMITEGYAFPLWYVFARRGAPAMVTQGMPPGEQYFYSRVISHRKRKGTRANMMNIVVHSRSGIASATGAQELFNRDVSGALRALPY